jgi:peroxiredoxin
LFCCCFVIVAAFVAWGNVAIADDQPTEQKAAPALPAEATSWLNSAPITLASLEGKGAVLWFFDQDSSKVRAKWPELAALVKKYENQPVVLIAVTSGKPRAAVQSYVQQVKSSVPVVVDTSQQFAQAVGISGLSADNFAQARVINAAGKLLEAHADDLDAAAKTALDGAAWKVDPKPIPDGLHKAWQAIEFANYTAAGPTVTKALSSTDAATKQGAEKLAAAVKPIIDAAAKEAKEALDGGDKWAALSKYNAVTKRFDGFELPPEFVSQRQSLLTDPQMKAIAAAAKSLEATQHMISVVPTLSPTQKKRCELALEQVQKDAAGTDLARQAEELEKKLGMTAK